MVVVECLVHLHLKSTKKNYVALHCFLFVHVSKFLVLGVTYQSAHFLVSHYKRSFFDFNDHLHVVNDVVAKTT